MNSICPICKTENNINTTYSNVVCRKCIILYGILDESGEESIDFCVKNDIIYSKVNNLVSTKQECMIANVPCYAILSNNKLLFVKTIKIL